MANFILIHGAMHGGWCWERVVPLLARHGHHVSAPDLPGMGETRLPAAEVTLQAWSHFTADLLKDQPDKSILVGHSLAGMVISQAAEIAPDRIANLVYLTALLPRNGLSAFNLTRGEDPSDARHYLYGDTPSEWAERAVSRLEPQPLAPLITPAELSDSNFGNVPRIYIECLRDRILPLSLQRKMHANSPCNTVLAIDTDHSPFYSAPEETAAHLLQIATQVS
jgi:pimeloyl-ACP methyl ester carboxylesterase